MWKQTCGKVCLGYKKLEPSHPLCSGVAWGKTGNSRPNNIRKQLHLIKSSCIKCRHLHLRYFLRSTGLIQLQLKWKSKLKIKSLSSPVTAKTFKIRWNNSMLCVSKKPVIQHQPQSPPIRHPSVIFETSVFYPFWKYILAPSARGSHKSPTLLTILAYLQYFTQCI